MTQPESPPPPDLDVDLDLDADIDRDDVCTFCGLRYQGEPIQCRRCGALLNDAAEEIFRAGEAQGRRLSHTRALSDLFFLVGLLLGGPMMTLGGELQIGLFIALAGAFASILRRYSDWSTPGTVVAGAAIAALFAALIVEPAQEPDETPARQEARRAFAAGLNDPATDFYVVARGPELTTIWFSVPPGTTQECGDYPSTEVRQHLARLGFARVVVPQDKTRGALCSFEP